jgi:hypothetical protein
MTLSPHTPELEFLDEELITLLASPAKQDYSQKT